MARPSHVSPPADVARQRRAGADPGPRARAAAFERYAWGVLAFSLLVILWGAYVRASGSGAGCGSHWPLCNGVVVPRAPALATVIELTHRVTSGVALVLVAGLLVGAWRTFPRGHLVRRAAAASALFLVSEALIGAGLVLLEYVAHDRRIARGFWVAGHLANTFFLVASLALTAWWSNDARARPVRVRGGTGALLSAALLGMLVLGVSGAVTALGDTLFPVASLAQGEAQTFSESAHLFVRLRIWHPALALVVGIVATTAAATAARRRGDPLTRRLALALVALYGAQLAVGVANVWLLAPIPVQIAHLLLSDACWIALVLLAAESLGEASARSSAIVNFPSARR